MRFFKSKKKIPEISFNKKLTAQEVVESIKSGNYKHLKKLFPRIKAGKKRLSRIQTLCFFVAMLGIGIFLSKILNNPFPFFLFLAISYGSGYVFNEADTTFISVALIDSTHFVVCYRDIGNSSYGTAIIGTIASVDEISYGSEYVFNEASSAYISVALIDSTHFVVCYQDGGSSDYGTAIIGTIANDDEISFGSKYFFNEASSADISVALIDSTHFVVCYRDTGNGSYGTAIIGTIASVDEISYGSEYVFNEALTYYNSVALIDSTHFVVCYRDIGNSSYGTAIIGTIASVDEISYGSEYVFNEAVTYYNSVALIDSTHFVVCYRDGGSSDYGTAIIGTIANDDEISFGSKYFFNEAETSFISVALIDSTHFVVCYQDDGGDDYGIAIIGTIANDDEISFGSEYPFNEANSDYHSVALIDSTHFVVCYRDVGNSSYGTAIIGSMEEPVATSPNRTKKNNYSGYNAFVQQFIKHRINDTTPWSHPDGFLIE